MQALSTQEKILSSAKHLFREKGFAAMRVTDICRELNISKGNLTYYFPTKNSIIARIFKDYYKEINLFIVNAMLPIEHFYSRELYSSIIADINIFRNDDSRKFYDELIEQPIQREINLKRCSRQIRTLHEHNCVTATAQELEYLAEGMAGAYDAIDKLFISKNDFSIESIYTHVILKQFSRVSMWSVRRIDSDVEESKASVVRHLETLKRRDFSDIHLI